MKCDGCGLTFKENELQNFVGRNGISGVFHDKCLKKEEEKLERLCETKKGD